MWYECPFKNWSIFIVLFCECWLGGCLCFKCHLLQGQTPLMRGERCSDLWVLQWVIRSNLLCSYGRVIVFASPEGPITYLGRGFGPFNSMGLISWSVPWISNQKVLYCFHNINATPEPVGLSCHDSICNYFYYCVCSIIPNKIWYYLLEYSICSELIFFSLNKIGDGIAMFVKDGIGIPIGIHCLLIAFSRLAIFTRMFFSLPYNTFILVIPLCLHEHSMTQFS